MQLSDLIGDAEVVALVDPGVLRDIATSLTGLWRPGDEVDISRRSELVAAARLRLYADHEHGWALVTTRSAREGVDKREDADWSAGFVPAVEDADDGVVAAEVESLTTLFRTEESLDAEVARTLAVAVMCPAVRYLVTRDPTAYRHRREHDLRDGLEIVDPLDAVNHLMLAPDEPPISGPLPGSLLESGDHWWVP